MNFFLTNTESSALSTHVNITYSAEPKHFRIWTILFNERHTFNFTFYTVWFCLINLNSYACSVFFGLSERVKVYFIK